MKDMTKTLVNHMLDNKEHHLKIDVLEKNSDIVFSRVRRIEDDILPKIHSTMANIKAEVGSLSELPGKMQKMEEWVGKIKGVIFIIPISCTIVTTIATIMTIWIKINP